MHSSEIECNNWKQETMDRMNEETATSSAGGVEYRAPGCRLATDTIHVTLTDTGGENTYEDDPWQLIRDKDGPDQMDYMGDLMVQGLDGNEYPDTPSLPSYDPGEMFMGRGGTPRLDSLDQGEARLVQIDDDGAAASSSSIRLFSETLAPQQHHFFWETDPFLQMILGNKSTADVILGSGQTKRPPGGVVDVGSIVSEPSAAKVIKRQPVKPIPLHARALKHVAEMDEKTKRQSLMSDWATLVAIDVNSSAIGAMLQAEGISRGGILDAIASCFAAKATSTLTKRYSAMKRYVHGPCSQVRQVFPIAEHAAYSYVVELREDITSSATSAQSFFEALHFAAAL